MPFLNSCHCHRKISLLKNVCSCSHGYRPCHIYLLVCGGGGRWSVCVCVCVCVSLSICLSVSSTVCVMSEEMVTLSQPLCQSVCLSLLICLSVSADLSVCLFDCA